MTTAARPTFDTARGGTQKGEGNLSVLSKQYSNRDLPGQTKLKVREKGQDSVDEVRSRDFKRELEDREEKARREKEKSKRQVDRFRDAVRDEVPSKRSRGSELTQANLDADDKLSDQDEDDSSEDDDEDDTAELLAELQRIKRERAEEIAKKERDKRTEEERIRTENLLAGNPLLNSQGPSDFSVKRRWDDDVVFKNCSKDEDTKPKQKNFINDTIRSDFHRRFMDKYVK